MENSSNRKLTGYLHPAYAASLAEFGTPLKLPACGGWALRREIPGTTWADAMGCYPLFACSAWERIHQDLSSLEGALVSFSLVTDPFGSFQPDDLQRSFDVCYPYKRHFITDLSKSMETFINKSHRRNARRALKKLEVEPCLDPLQHLEEWTALYDTLIERHKIQGMRRFSKESFRTQLGIPGAVYFRIRRRGETVGGDIYILQNGVVYSHLSAYSQEGYRLDAAYAGKWAEIEYFKGKAEWLCLGAGAGLRAGADDGLSYFKRGWSTGDRPVYFCGRILDRERYAGLAAASGNAESAFFPTYRAGEFT